MLYSGNEKTKENFKENSEVCCGWSRSECNHIKNSYWKWLEKWRNAISTV